MRVELTRTPGLDIGHLIVRREVGCANCRAPEAAHAEGKCLYDATSYVKGDDPKYYSESALLYAVKKALLAQGHDVIKKRMQKDGHMYGDESLQYLRTRRRRKDPDSFYAYDTDYAIRSLCERWNERGEVVLAVNYDVFD